MGTNDETPQGRESLDEISRPLDDQDYAIQAKLKINELIWMFAPSNLTLAEAERLAIVILDGLRDGQIEATR